MGDVLDQNEVDALLAAVEGGEIDLPVEPAAPAAGRAARAGRAPSAYDFRRPEPVSKEQLRALEVLHEAFARTLGATLSGRLRHIVEIRLETIDQLTYSEFILSLPNPTCFNILTCQGLVGGWILEIHPTIAFPLIELLLGASDVGPQVPERPLTELEMPIVRDVVARAIAEMERVWSPVRPMDLSLSGTESNPQLVQLHSANEPVVLMSFQVTIADRAGRMNLCIPFVSIEPLMPDLTRHVGFGRERREIDPEERATLHAGLGLVDLDARVLLVETTLRLSDVLHLEPGDIVTTDRPATAHGLLYVEEKPKFWIRPGVLRGKRSAQIQGQCLSTDHV